MKPLRKALFWLHLVLGVTGGIVIAALAFTGAAMALEPELMAAFDRGSRAIKPVPDAPRLSAQQLVDHIADERPELEPSGMIISSDPTQTTQVRVARSHLISIHPQNGTILGERTPHNFFTWMLRIHVRLSAGDIGNTIVVWSNIFFIILCVSGLYLWWPKTKAGLSRLIRFNFKLRRRAFHWHLHNVTGFWSFAVLLLIAFTGLMMSYRWASDLPYTLTGSAKAPSTEKVELAEGTPFLPVDEAIDAAILRQPDWSRLSIYFPTPSRGTYRFFILGEDPPHPYASSRLYLHGATGEELTWEEYAEYNIGRTIRSYVLPLHMGTVAGLPGRLIAFFACVAAIALVVTGYVLTWRRFRPRKRVKS